MLKLYNTLTRKKEVFKPIQKGKNVKLFVCGPTVYDYAHLGHAKTYINFDVIGRYLRFVGYKVNYVQNITDIDDKIINRSIKENLGTDGWKKIKDEYEKSYKEDMESLNVVSVDKYAGATNYIKEIISQVKRLIKKGYAYKISDGWYFDLSKDKEYGKLSKRTFSKKDDSFSRIDENKEKRNSGDFCLWKFSKENEPSWKSDIGDGRPGWHIEDTAITEKEFGVQYDIHGGGQDLIFPHHEAEIAQMESISGKKPLAKYWIHTGFLKIEKEKMSKSTGNFKTIKDLLKDYKGEIIRYFVLSTHYKKPLNFSMNALEDAKNSYQRLKNIVSELKENGEVNKGYLKKFEEAMDDDLNTPKALQVLWKLVRDKKAKGKIKTIKKMDEVFGLGLFEKEDIEVPSEIIELVKEREKARKEKNWKLSDSLREEIKKKGYSVDDTEKGSVVKKL